MDHVIFTNVPAMPYARLGGGFAVTAREECSD